MQIYKADICGKAVIKKADFPTDLLHDIEEVMKKENWGNKKTTTCVVYLQNPNTLNFEKVKMFKFNLPDCKLVKILSV